jgi:hypothetical protein
MSGCHYDFIDFTILPGRERSTEDGRRLLRSRFAVLARFWEENKIWSTVLDDQAQVIVPEGCTGIAVHANHSLAPTRYVYVAAQVPSNLVTAFSDRPIEGTLQLNVPPGAYLSCWFAPETGRYFGWNACASTGVLSLQLPGIPNDVVAIIKG